ncbi:MAG TPA: ATP-dependent RNA helicase [Bacteroidetes bacterium]|nr:ATP-dependent RNA helicase [Bacteroidota bacterium]
MNFHEFSFTDKLLDGLDAMGFEKATPIQEQAIPLVLEGRDLIACAQTGTGKTAAYLLPILSKLTQTEGDKVRALIIAPTRELVQQIDQQVEGFAYFLGVSSIPVFGGGDGSAYEQQRRAFDTGADLVIATPGRLISHLISGTVDMSALEFLVLDEADRMLDMGFYEDIERIIQKLPTTRQTLLFSATMPPRIRDLAAKILKDPAQISLAISKPAANIVQQSYLAYDTQKTPLLQKILSSSDFQSALIFTSTKDKAKSLEKEMIRSGFEARAIHSDLDQKQREEVMLAFRNRQLKFLIGTDIVSRGIDVDGIELVVNYDVPPDPEDYIHRIGRTARAERNGIAITFISDKDGFKFKKIEELIEKEIPKFQVPASLGESPVLSTRPVGGGGRGGKGGGFKGKPKRRN